MNAAATAPAMLPTTEDWRLCEEIARVNGRSFYLASRCLAPSRRRAIRATYAWCRLTDDIVDRGDHDAASTADTLAEWETQLTNPHHAVAATFAYVRDTYNVPLEPALDLIAGARMDLTTSRYQTWDDLRVYCHNVAGTVGLLVAPILGCRDPAAHGYAAELGIAMQLTNILRDVAEDATMGRLYLPLDDLAAFGCDPDAVMAGHPGPGFRDLMAFEIDRARAMYASAMRGIPALRPSGQFATLAASRFYAGILDEIEAMDYDIFRQRAYVPSSRKIRSLPRIALSVASMTILGSARIACG